MRLTSLIFLLFSSFVTNLTSINGNADIQLSGHLNFTAKVIRILDGDTMEVLYQNKPIKIRLAHIDCPEKKGNQPFGNQAKIALANLCFSQNVAVIGQSYDRNKRLIAVIINQKKQNVNKEMVKQGMAWHFKRYSKDITYTKLEAEARRKKMGLWSDAKPVAPWAWRGTPKTRK